MPASAHQAAADSGIETCVGGDLDRKVAPHGGDVEVAAQVVGALLDGLLLARCQLAGVRDHALQVAVAPQQVGSGLLTDAARSGMLSDGSPRSAIRAVTCSGSMP